MTDLSKKRRNLRRLKFCIDRLIADSSRQYAAWMEHRIDQIRSGPDLTAISKEKSDG